MQRCALSLRQTRLRGGATSPNGNPTHMSRLTSSQFMRALPDAVRPLLPPELRKFKSQTRAWLCQLYYRDPQLHYEVWNQGERRGLLEVGLHFESRNPLENERYLRGLARYLTEIKAQLGFQWEAEQWTKSWTKIYQVVKYEPFSDVYLDTIASRLAQAVTVLQPMFEETRATAPK
jgi:hypothetical protein